MSIDEVKKIFFFSFLLGGLFFFSSPLEGSEYAARKKKVKKPSSKRTSLFLGLGGNFPLLDGEFDQGEVGGDSVTVNSSSFEEGDSAFSLSAGGLYQFNSYFGLGVDFLYDEVGFDSISFQGQGSSTNVDVRGQVKDFDLFSSHLIGQVSYPLSSGSIKFFPYFRLGLGAAGVAPNFDEENFSFEDDVVFSLLIGGGAEMVLSLGPKNTLPFRKIGIFLEARWLYQTVDFKVTTQAGGSFPGEMEISLISLLVGIRFYL